MRTTPYLFERLVTILFLPFPNPTHKMKHMSMKSFALNYLINLISLLMYFIDTGRERKGSPVAEKYSMSTRLFQEEKSNGWQQIIHAQLFVHLRKR